MPDSVENEVLFFCGIGGSGMSSLAQVMNARGVCVRGSDRSRDRGEGETTYARLGAQGIELWPQDGTGVDASVSTLVVSSAVEPSIPDVKAAVDAGVPIRRRADLLADLLHEGRGIAVGGTSGKSTVTGMIGHILSDLCRDPTVIVGGRMLNAEATPLLGNALMGSGTTVIEADESDGTIELYTPTVGVVTNISLDHKPLGELRVLFSDFAERTTEGVVLNADCPDMKRQRSGAKTFSFLEKSDFQASVEETRPNGSDYALNGVSGSLRLPGAHNVANAAAAIATCAYEGVSVEDAVEALRTFKGIGRRLEVLGTANGVTVIDDFAHNPDKIDASLEALSVGGGRLRVMFQPHGFGPTRLLKEGLIDALSRGLGDDDALWMPEIYFAGGTATKDISSNDLVEPIVAGGKRARFVADRSTIAREMVEASEPGDCVVIMGARDDTLTDFAHDVLNMLRGQG